MKLFRSTVPFLTLSRLFIGGVTLVSACNPSPDERRGKPDHKNDDDQGDDDDCDGDGDGNGDDDDDDDDCDATDDASSTASDNPGLTSTGEPNPTSTGAPDQHHGQLDLHRRPGRHHGRAQLDLHRRPGQHHGRRHHHELEHDRRVGLELELDR